MHIEGYIAGYYRLSRLKLDQAIDLMEEVKQTLAEAQEHWGLKRDGLLQAIQSAKLVRDKMLAEDYDNARKG